MADVTVASTEDVVSTPGTRGLPVARVQCLVSAPLIVACCAWGGGVCACVCVDVCACACVRACVRVYVCVCARVWMNGWMNG